MPHFPFQRLQDDLAAMITRLPAGSKLPSEPELAKQLGVSRATLREAMRMFETQGHIRRRQGAGTFIVGQIPVIESGLEVLESLETMAHRLNLTVSMGDAAIERISASEEQAAILGLAIGAPLVRISRVMRTDSRPVAYLVDVLPEDVLRPDELNGGRFSGSVLDYLLQRGDPLSVSRAEVSAIGASADVAKMLEIQRGDVLLEIIAQLFNGGGRVVAYSFSYFLPGYFKFHVVRRVGGGA